MKTSIFQNILGGTNACMKILAISTKYCVQLTSNNTYFSGIWFNSVKNSEETADAGVNYCVPVKTIHKCFGLATLESFDENLARRVISFFEE